MSIINIEDYRAPEKKNVPCTLSFCSGVFKTPEGRDTTINWQVTVQDGDFAGVIEVVKREGGVYMPSQDGGKTFWFVPWPFVAVQIRVGKK